MHWPQQCKRITSSNISAPRFSCFKDSMKPVYSSRSLQFSTRSFWHPIKARVKTNKTYLGRELILRTNFQIASICSEKRDYLLTLIEGKTLTKEKLFIANFTAFQSNFIGSNYLLFLHMKCGLMINSLKVTTEKMLTVTTLLDVFFSNV